MKPRILFLLPSDYDDICRKGVAPLIAEKNEHGFFERVAIIHPTAGHTRILDLAPDLRIYEFKEFFLPFCRRFKALRYPHHLVHVVRILWNVLQIIRSERVDILRATDPAFTGALAWLATRVCRLPFCVSIHADYDKRFDLDPLEGAPTLFNSRRMARWIEGFVLRHATQAWPIRATLGDKVQALGVPPERIRVIPHGIDMAPFRRPPDPQFRPSLGLPEGVALLCFAGRLSKDNYVHDILDLASALKPVRSDFCVVLAGEGSERDALERRVQSEDLAGCVRLVGRLSREQVLQLWKESDISLCLMAGYSLIEACAGGHPVISYDVEWHSELVKTGETGWLLPEHDRASLVKAASNLLDHPDTARSLGLRAQALVFERHDELKTSALKRRYYEEMLTTAKGTR